MVLVIYVHKGQIEQVEDCTEPECKILVPEKDYVVVDLDKVEQQMEGEEE